MNKTGIMDLMKHLESESIVGLTFKEIPRIYREKERWMVCEPIPFPSPKVSITLFIVGEKTYRATVEVNLDRLLFRDDWSDLQEGMNALIERTRTDLKGAGLIPHDKKPEPVKLPDWMVR